MPDGDSCGCAPGTLLKPGAAALRAAAAWDADAALCEACARVRVRVKVRVPNPNPKPNPKPNPNLREADEPVIGPSSLHGVGHGAKRLLQVVRLGLG